MVHRRSRMRHVWGGIAAVTAGTAFAVVGPLGAATAVSPGTPAQQTAATSSQQAFIKKVAPAAQQAQRVTGVPASVAIAQAALESGWGQSSLTTKYANYFGIKCYGGRGSYAVGCVSVPSREVVKGKSVASVSSFRSYPNATASFDDYGQFLRTNSRYKSAFRYTGNPDQFIRQVVNAGYATDPAYADKVITIMKQNNLYRYN